MLTIFLAHFFPLAKPLLAHSAARNATLSTDHAGQTVRRKWQQTPPRFILISEADKGRLLYSPQIPSPSSDPLLTLILSGLCEDLLPRNGAYKRLCEAKIMCICFLLRCLPNAFQAYTAVCRASRCDYVSKGVTGGKSLLFWVSWKSHMRSCSSNPYSGVHQVSMRFSSLYFHSCLDLGYLYPLLLPKS